MENLSFNEAMEFMYEHSGYDKRRLNKSLREYYSAKTGKKMRVKEADVFVSQFVTILDTCHNLAVENWHSKYSPNYEALVFRQYPRLDPKLKSKIVQLACFMVFR